ncbi:MAG TPA: tryptophan--tRNA ligase, partial [Candidatus Omnitrophota bacterium]|nr:tryptophan--tRNA ligase [Candidatus Omnitrophota bacterium]
GAATRVMSLRDGTKKMSKSDESDYSRINMTDDADTIALKVRKAKTDLFPMPDTLDGLAERPEASNLIGIYAALSDKDKAAIVEHYAGQQFSDFKKDLVDLAVSVLGPINTEMKRLMEDTAHIDAILKKGAERANAIAEPIIKDVYDIVGFLRP